MVLPVTTAYIPLALSGFGRSDNRDHRSKADCLEKNRVSLQAFYDLPAEHWSHLRITNSIESTFATVRFRTNKTRGCVSRKSILAMVFKQVKSAERHWRKLNGIPRLAQVVEGIIIKDEIQEDVEKVAA